MTPSPRAATLLAATAGLLLGACGGSLYDAAGVPKVDVNGCDTVNQHVCPGLDTTCRGNTDPDYCGTACEACGAAPTGGARACVASAVDGHWTCGFTCTAPARACAARSACLPDDVNACGLDCQVCSAPANAVATCAPATTGGSNQCGFACKEGFFACASGCCQPTAVAAGGDQGCAITSDGGLSCWGANGSGQLGRAGAGGPAPGMVGAFSSGVTQVAVGGQHACAVRAGTVWCWGDDTLGQLGDGAAVSSGPTPVPTGLGGVARLVAGNDHTCALVTGGVVKCWGANNKGQLGTGTTGGQATAPPAAGIAGLTGVTALAAGGDTTCALSGASVRCWGGNASGQASPGGAAVVNAPAAAVALPAAASAVTLGGAHACAIVAGAADPLQDGLNCWGANESGQLGTGTAGTPGGPLQSGRIDNGQNALLAAAGGAFTCSTSDGLELLCNGRNDQSQCGAAASPTLLDRIAVSLGGGAVARLAAGRQHACALVDEGVAGLVVRCWGRNAEGQLGRDTQGLPSLAGSPVPGPP
jgi:alpha-tubulin suppressor-like RCC1 family protein